MYIFTRRERRDESCLRLPRHSEDAQLGAPVLQLHLLLALGRDQPVGVLACDEPTD